MKTWEQAVEDASAFIHFLENGKFLSKPYRSKSAHNYLVITDIQMATEIMSGVLDDGYSNREDVFESNFPDNFIWYLDRISTKLIKCNYFNFTEHGFYSVKGTWTDRQIDIVTETMNLDIEMLLKCYVNEYFTELWTEILDIYLNYGFPCGWKGQYPEGQLIILSNE